MEKCTLWRDRIGNMEPVIQAAGRQDKIPGATLTAVL